MSVHLMDFSFGESKVWVWQMPYCEHKNKDKRAYAKAWAGRAGVRWVEWRNVFLRLRENGWLCTEQLVQVRLKQFTYNHCNPFEGNVVL